MQNTERRCVDQAQAGRDMCPLRMMILKNWNGTQAVPYKNMIFLDGETYTLSVSFADSSPRGRAKWGMPFTLSAGGDLSSALSVGFADSSPRGRAK